jgi:alpha-1,6-mannosyltransferase
MTDEPHAAGPASENGHAGSNRIEANAFRAPPFDEPPTSPQSAASRASAQSAWHKVSRQVAERRSTPTGLRYLGLAGALGVALAGPRPVGLAGVAVLAAAWSGLRGVTGTRWLLVTAGLWALPLLAVPPLFSGDAYAYACQGDLYVHGLSPYQHGVADLPCPWLDRVPSLWWHTPTPYGPLWVAITGGAAATGNVWVAIGALRLVAFAGIALAVGFGRRLGADPAWLAAASPLVLIHGVSGAHNDALLAGLVVAGLALAKGARWGVLAGALLGLAVAVKVTALVAVPFAVLLVARRRAWAGVAAGAAGCFAAVTAATGLGFGWLPALAHTAADLTQWTSPPTGVGMAAGYLLRAAGRPDLAPDALAVARVAGLVALAVLLAVLWWRRKPAGVALAATALLGPIFFPWYALMPLAVLAATPLAERTRDRLGLATAALALLVLPDGTGIASLTKPVGAFLDVVLVSAVVVGLVRRLRAGRARPTPTPR